MSERLDTKGRELVEAKLQAEQDAAVASASSARHRELEAEFWALVDDLGITTVNIDVGELTVGDVTINGKVQFQKRETVTANVLNAEELAKELEAAGLGHILGPAAVRKKALNELVRQRRKSGEEIPAGAEPNVRKYVTVGIKN